MFYIDVVKYFLHLMPTIHTQLKSYRLNAKLTQDQLATQVGVTRQTINAIEAGKYQPTLFLAWQLARLFEVRIEDIFTF